MTERRAVLHVALRAPRGVRIEVDGADVVPDVHKMLDAMVEFATRLRSGAFTGHTGKRIRNIVNFGICDPIWGLRWPIGRCAHSATDR